MNVSKILTDDEITKQSGKFFVIDDDWKYIQSQKSKEKIIIYKIDSSGETCGILAILYKGAISPELCKTAVQKYTRAGKMISTNRGNAAGAEHRLTNISSNIRYEKGLASNSAIIGYIDSSNHKRPCRLTAFSRKYYKDYTDGLKFIEEIDTCFKECLPDIHSRQSAVAASSENFQIGTTAFSTVTVNYNFQTALHKDSGDFREGFGNLVVCQEGITGGEILFPQYKVAIRVDTGDFLAMDVHEWHCNNEIQYNNDTAYRLSFVCYLREKISHCNEINKNLLSLTGNLDGKSWNTDIIFNKIFECIGFRDLPNKVSLSENVPWWSMTSGRFKLMYKFKRYTLFDNLEDGSVIKIHNLIPAYNYALGILNKKKEDAE